jgi:hypothetical protein
MARRQAFKINLSRDSLPDIWVTRLEVNSDENSHRNWVQRRGGEVGHGGSPGNLLQRIGKDCPC